MGRGIAVPPRGAYMDPRAGAAIPRTGFSVVFRGRVQQSLFANRLDRDAPFPGEIFMFSNAQATR